MDRGDGPRDARGDTVQMRVNLRVVGGFISLCVIPIKNATGPQGGDDQQERDDRGHAAAGSLWRRLGNGSRTRGLFDFFRLHHGLPKSCRTPWSACPMARARLALARLWASRLLM